MAYASIEQARAYGRDYYHKDPERHKKNRAYKARNVAYLIEYLQHHPCVDCGEDDIEVLEFDHIELVGSKRKRVASFLHSTSLDRLKKDGRGSLAQRQRQQT